MADRFHYGQLMRKAMQSLMAEVLSEVAEHGLPGAHHFFITFDTSHPGVDMTPQLRARFADDNDMTIVIQNWFENLVVLPDRFTITLNFSDTAEPMVIPFDAIQTFVDPSVEFGLRFDGREDDSGPHEVEPEEDEVDETPDDVPPSGGGDVVSIDQFRKN